MKWLICVILLYPHNPWDTAQRHRLLSSLSSIPTCTGCPGVVVSLRGRPIWKLTILWFMMSWTVSNPILSTWRHDTLMREHPESLFQKNTSLYWYLQEVKSWWVRLLLTPSSHQVRGKEGQQRQRHIRLIWLVEVKLCNTARIRVRVACSSDKLTQFLSAWAAF